MAGDPNTAHVRVVLKRGKNPDYQLHSPLMENGKLTFRNNGHPGFKVFFDLEDPDGSGYQFPDDENMAIAVTKKQNPPVSGWDCPDQGATWPIFQPKRIWKDGNLRNMTLEVTNPNPPGQEGDFGYSLFVTQQPDGSGGPASYWKLDPIGSNQNGPEFIGPDSGLGWATYAAITVAAVALIAFALYEFGVFGR